MDWEKKFWLEHYRSCLCVPRIELNGDVSLKTKTGLRESLLSVLSDMDGFTCCLKPIST